MKFVHDINNGIWIPSTEQGDIEVTSTVRSGGELRWPCPGWPPPLPRSRPRLDSPLSLSLCAANFSVLCCGAAGHGWSRRLSRIRTADTHTQVWSSPLYNNLIIQIRAFDTFSVMTCHKCYYCTIVHIYKWLQTSIFHMKPLKKLLDISNKTRLQELCFGLVKIERAETLKMNDCTYQISNVAKLSHFHVTCVIDSYWKNWTIKKTMLRQVTGTVLYLNS